MALILSCLGLLTLLGGAAYIYKDRELEPLPQAKSLTPRPWREGLVVGLVGDSWVSSGDLGNALQASLEKNGLNTQVISSGHPGAKSRQIYRNLLAVSKTRYSSRHVLDAKPDYLVVVAGVNDSAGHIGRSYYAHHVLAIIKLAQANGIHPVVIEVPEYGAEEARAPNPIFGFKRLMYRFLFDGGRKNVIQHYRERLRDLTLLESYEDLSVVAFDDFIPDYHAAKDRYQDPLHLTPGSSAALAAVVAKAVIRRETRQTGHLTLAA